MTPKLEDLQLEDLQRIYRNRSSEMTPKLEDLQLEDLQKQELRDDA